MLKGKSCLNLSFIKTKPFQPLKLKRIKIRKSSKDEISISKIERVIAIFVSQVVTKSQIHEIFKSQNLTAFLRGITRIQNPDANRVKEYKYIQPLIRTPDPLPETVVLANHSSDFMLPKRTHSQPAGWINRPRYGGCTTT